MQAISLQVFIKRSMLLAVTSIESEYSKAGMGGWWVSEHEYINYHLVLVYFTYLAAKIYATSLV